MMKTGQTLRLRVGAATIDSELDFPLPEGWTATVYPMRDRPAMAADDIRAALQNTVGSEPISKAARGAKSVVLLVDDFRRPTPAQTLSRAVIDELQQAGVPLDGITIILGNGCHRAMNRKEVRKRLGSLCDTVRVLSHDGYSSDVTYVGLTSAGTPVLLNSAAVAADYSVSISSVYPHRLVNWGGGAKMVLPGVAHVSTIYCHHGRLPAGTWSGAPGQSVSRRDIEEAAALFGLNCALNAVINSQREMCGLYAGEPVQAHRAAVKLARKVGDTPVDDPAPDLIIANAYPFDADGTQYTKAQAPAAGFDCPVLMLNDFADPSIYHGLYHGPRKAFEAREPLQPQERTDDLLIKAKVFFYSPQYACGFVPPDRTWYCDNDWQRLMADMARRFKKAKVAVFPVAPLQLPRVTRRP